MKPYPKEGIIPFALLIKEAAPDLEISILEIGARPVTVSEEPYHVLLEIFQNAKISAFELDDDLCQELNSKTHERLRYYPCALGKQNGKQTLHETKQPMCSSLYKTDTDLVDKYFGLDPAMPKAEHEIEVSSLDHFISENNIGPTDMIKIDIQGAELDVFQGGEKAVSESTFIVSEVEFIPLYENQPLFGDVCNHLQKHDFMFHKFVGLALNGRCLKPIAIQNNIEYPSQLMWSDAIFIRNIKSMESLSDDELYKSALFSFIYGSPDLTFFCLKILDDRNKTNLCVQLGQLGK